MSDVYLLKSVGKIIPVDCVDVVFLDVLGKLRCTDDGVRYAGVYEFINELMYILIVKCLMSSTTVIVHTDYSFWSKPVAMVLFMLCITVLISVEWLVIQLWCRLWFMRGTVLSSVLTNTEINKMVMCQLPRLLGFFLALELI